MIKIYTYSLEYGYLGHYQTETSSPTYGELVDMSTKMLSQNGFVDEAHVYVPYELRDRVTVGTYERKGVNAETMVKVKVDSLDEVLHILHSLSDDIKTDWPATYNELQEEVYRL